MILLYIRNSLINKESSCWKRNASPDLFADRIAGGSIATPNEFPWQEFLEISLSTLRKYACGGTLIDHQWVLTSASCVDGVTKPEDPHSPGQQRVGTIGVRDALVSA